MAYQALYRKYRPSSFEEVVGQRQIVKTLTNAISRNRIAHAYLFSGPRGTGKTSIAKIFARTLNCTGEHKPCGECDNCKAALSGSHPDIVEIDAASNNGVDEVRNIIDRISYSPMMGEYKVYIIDEVHMMSSGAFNALLKTIEEPPEDVIFIFATTEPNKVLPTILSRCQRFDFSKVSDPDIIHRLKQVCEAEKITIDDDSLALIASLADGGMRDSLSILDQCSAFAGEDPITPTLIREIYGVVTSEDIGKIFADLTPEKADEAVAALKRISDQGMDLKRFTADLISLLKDSLLLDYAPNTELITGKRRDVLSQYFLPASSRQRRFLLSNLMDVYNKFVYASSILDYLETSLLQSIYLPPEPSHDQQYDHADIHRNGRKSGSDDNGTIRNNPGKSPKPSRKTSFSTQFFQSDVSRETISHQEDDDLNSLLYDEKILGMLVAADKQTKKKISDHISELPKYLNDLKYAKFASALQNVQLMAAGEHFMIVHTQHAAERDLINDLEDNQGFEDFTREVIGEPYRVYAVTSQKAKELIGQFKTRAANKSLPAAVKIELRNTGADQPVKAVDELSGEDAVRAMFPDVKVIED